KGEAERTERKEYHYYTYSSKHDANELPEPAPVSAVSEDDSPQTAVVVSEPSPAPAAAAKPNWSAAPRKKGGFRRAFSAFLAGALVMGGLMFGADHYNVFTGASG